MYAPCPKPNKTLSKITSSVWRNSFITNLMGVLIIRPNSRNFLSDCFAATFTGVLDVANPSSKNSPYLERRFHQQDYRAFFFLNQDFCRSIYPASLMFHQIISITHVLSSLSHITDPLRYYHMFLSWLLVTGITYGHVPSNWSMYTQAHDAQWNKSAPPSWIKI